MREVVVFQDEPAEQVIERAAAFFAARGLVITHRTPLSVSFGSRVVDRAVCADMSEPALRIGGGTPGAGELPPGTGQLAAVPVQLKPEWCRVWVTTHDAHQGGAGADTVGDTAGEFVERERERSRRVEAQVRALEADVYGEAAWPAREAQLRAALGGSGTSAAEVDAKVEAFKQRWLALGRKAAKSGPEEQHLSA
jgi:hypothetical protein